MKKRFLSMIVASCLCMACNTTTEQSTVRNQKTVLPFELTEYNNIKFKTSINGTDSLALKFDSGTTGLLLTHDAIKDKTHLLDDGKEKTPTQNYVRLDSLVSLELGPLQWNNLEVYPVRHSGHGTDGRFGWDLFKEKIVIIDYDKSEMVVQDKLPDVRNFTKLKLNETETLLCFDGEIHVDNTPYKGRFLFDTGYQKALLLDSVILNQQDFPKDLSVIKTNKLRNGAGDVFITKVVEIPQIALGETQLDKIPAQVLNRSNPAGFTTHILGNELLKRFNTVLDLQEGYIYFEQNSLVKDSYSDAS